MPAHYLETEKVGDYFVTDLNFPEEWRICNFRLPRVDWFRERDQIEALADFPDDLPIEELDLGNKKVVDAASRASWINNRLRVMDLTDEQREQYEAELAQIEVELEGSIE